jgi:hypothetical protein
MVLHLAATGARHNKGRRERGGRAIPDRHLEFEFGVGETGRYSNAA